MNRKKILMLLFAFAACSAAVPTVSAQESGWWIGGRVGYWHDKVEGVTSSGFALAPEFGHDFNAKWSLGGVLGFDYRKTGNTSAEVFVIEPYARYKYFSRDRFTLFVDGGFGVAMGDGSGWKVGLTPGLAFRISDHFKPADQLRIPRLQERLLQRRGRRIRIRLQEFRSAVRILLLLLTTGADGGPVGSCIELLFPVRRRPAFFRPPVCRPDFPGLRCAAREASESCGPAVVSLSSQG